MPTAWAGDAPQSSAQFQGSHTPFGAPPLDPQTLSRKKSFPLRNESSYPRSVPRERKPLLPLFRLEPGLQHISEGIKWHDFPKSNGVRVGVHVCARTSATTEFFPP